MVACGRSRRRPRGSANGAAHLRPRPASARACTWGRAVPGLRSAPAPHAPRGPDRHPPRRRRSPAGRSPRSRGSRSSRTASGESSKSARARRVPSEISAAPVRSLSATREVPPFARSFRRARSTGRPPNARGPSSPRRADPARPGTDTPARGGSRGSPRTRPDARRPHASSHSANRSCRSARCSFGIAWYAASRISRWRKRNASSPANSARSGRISSLRASASSREGTFGRSRLGRQRRHGARVEDLALDRPALDHRALLGVQPVQAGGEQELDRRRHRDVARGPRPARHAPSSNRRSPSSISMPSISSTNSGLPSAASRIRSRAAGGDVRAPEQVVDQHARPRRPRAARAGSRWRSSSRRPSPGGARAARAARRRAAGAAASRVQSARCSIRSRKVGSAQWMSSNTTTSGRSRARCSRSLRTAQNASSVATGSPQPKQAGDERGDPLAVLGAPRRGPRAWIERSRDRRSRPTPAASLDDLGEREERDALAVGQASAAQDRRRRRRSGEELLRRAGTSRRRRIRAA